MACRGVSFKFPIMIHTIESKENKIYSLLRILAYLPLLFLFAACGTTKVAQNTNLLSVRENNSTVADFVKYVNANNNLTPDHTYIKNALIKLADATNAIAGEVGYTIKRDLTSARNYANDLTANANESTHANDIRKSANILSAELEGLQMGKYPDLKTDISDLKSAAAAINPDVLTRNQKEAIMTYLSQSAALLDRMN
jgi:hypothetical protein